MPYFLGEGDVTYGQPMNDGLTAVGSAERSLRDVVRRLIGESWREVPGMPSASQIEERRRSEARNRPGIAQQDDDLDFLYIKDLEKLYRARHRDFTGVFPDKLFFESMLNVVVRYRNTPSHGRELVRFESDLLNGASGYIANQIAIYQDDKDDADSHYPRINFCRDSFNYDLTVGGRKPDNAIGMPSYDTAWGKKLDVGDRITYRCIGVNPRAGTTLRWTLSSDPAGPIDEAEGDDVNLTWQVEPRHVSTGTRITVSLSSTSAFHRHQAVYEQPHDDARALTYYVRPPLHG